MQRCAGHFIFSSILGAISDAFARCIVWVQAVLTQIVNKTTETLQNDTLKLQMQLQKNSHMRLIAN